ncbi:hypothetical protein F5148DRAFT_588385 [Russula earlei]|uniref:Uncharacterized protein n=1 Tax=Russula earlei TaxID=71964 RepID=A0ACC0TVY9_9AGAM|nr:hypothetical protein F5148DRAFT_588385 [Russula earlei]
MFTFIAEPPAYTPASDLPDPLDDLRPCSSTPPPAYTERPAHKLRITSLPGAGILNASILDATGHLLYTTISDAKLKKTSVRRAGPYLDLDAEADVAAMVELARFGWDRASPRVRFCGGDTTKRKRKVKCKVWLPLASSSGIASDLQSRVLTLDGAPYSITERKGGVGYLLRADNEGTSLSLPLARWYMAPDAKSQRLEIFDDACEIPGLLDAFVLALIVLQCGQPLGEAPDCLNFASPRFFGTGDIMWRGR